MDAENAPNPVIVEHCVLTVNSLGLEASRGLGYFYSDLYFRVTVLFLVNTDSFCATLNLFQLKGRKLLNRMFDLDNT